MKSALRWTFLALGLALGVTELVALTNGQVGDTASELTWGMPWWGRVLVAGFCGWLFLHLGFKILPRPKDRQ